MRTVFLRSLVIAVAGSLLLAAGASAAINVTTTDDQSVTECTLRDAITAADTDSATGACGSGGADVDEIDIITTGQISLATPLPPITTSMSIVAPNSAVLEVRNAVATGPVFEISSASATVTLSGMQISNGERGVVNSGILTLQRVKVSGNSLTLAGGTPVAVGAGVYNLSSGDLTVTESTISGNSVSASGGATLQLAQGSAIESEGPLHMDQSTISGNTSTADGDVLAVARAAITVVDAPATIATSTISGNTATGNSTGNGFVSGGGIDFEVGGSSKALVLDRVTMTGNIANGDVSTQGGGVFLGGSQASGSIKGSTITGNTAGSGSNVAFNALQNVSFENTIIANPGGGSNCAAQGSGQFVSQGYNIDSGPLGSISSTDTCLRTGATGDQASTDPALGSLQDNGGPTLTMAPDITSPAVDKGTAAGASVDQRGFARTFDMNPANANDGTDVGAFEQVILTEPVIDFGPQKWGTTGFAQEVLFRNRTGNSLTAGAAALTGTDAAEFLIDADGCSSSAIANNDTCAANVAFSPRLPSIGARSASFSLPTNVSPAIPVGLMGTSTEYVSLLPAAHDFGSSQAGTPTGAFAFTATNLGPGTSGTLTAAVTGANASEFGITQDTCTDQTLPGSGSCTVSVRFAPTTVGAKSASLTVTGTPGGTNTSALTGTATAVPSGGGTPPAVTPPGPTGKRAAAVKKCKKKRGKARKRCLKRAKKLPV